jgi:tRNA pseudouridine13 synthase
MTTRPFGHPDDLPYLTRDVPGVGGVIKAHDEDFVVEEIPLYEACGAGTHTYFLAEKQSLTTLEAVRRIAQALGKAPRDVGYAGMKDAHGVTRQMLSIEHVPPERVAALELPRIRIVSVSRHGNKLKLGHLAGNRFQVRLRGAEPEAGPRISAIMAILQRRGVPNYFGPQRFGARGDNAWIGLAVMRGDHDDALARMLGRPGAFDHGAVRRARELYDAGRLEEAARNWPPRSHEHATVVRALIRAGGDARRAWSAVPHTLRKLYLSAVQSAVFNVVLAQRLERIDALEVGDLAWKHRNGACFLVEDLAAEQPRCDAFEISPSGPLFGRRMTPAQGTPGEREREALSSSGLELEHLLTSSTSRLDGARRPLRVPLGDWAVEEGTDGRGQYWELRFALPPGAYATGVLREVSKSGSSANTERPDE